MQISRHWRLNSQRYRLEGVRYANGNVSLQPRPVSEDDADVTPQNSKHDALEPIDRVVTANVA